MTISIDKRAVVAFLIVCTIISMIGLLALSRSRFLSQSNDNSSEEIDATEAHEAGSESAENDQTGLSDDPAAADGRSAAYTTTIEHETSAPSSDERNPESDLRADCTMITDSDHPQLGALPLQRVESQIRQAVTSGDPTPQLAQLHAQASRLSLQQGQFETAIGHLAQARSVSSMLGAGQDLLDELLLQEALVALRIGEEVNCIGPDSHAICLFVPSPEGGFTDPTHTEQAILGLQRYLRNNPTNLPARWLLNIAHMALRTYPDGVIPEWLIALDQPPLPREVPRFTEVAHDLGLATVSLLGGAIMEDFDGDGLLDLFVTTYDPCKSVRLFRNGGEGLMVDATAAAGLTGQLGGFNAQQTDFDNDGHRDIFITRGGWQGAHGRQRNTLLRNQGDGTFRDVTHMAGLAMPAFPTQTSAWADFDGDGLLDLYVGNEAYAPDPSRPDMTTAFPSQLFRNQGDGTFVDVASAAGVTNDRWAKGVAWGDFDNDGLPDLYVSNIGPNRLYRNLGDGTFEDVAVALGVDQPVGRSFATWFWDYDNDGHEDIFVAGYDATLAQIAGDYLGQPQGGVTPRLYRNTGAGRFEDVTTAVGLNRIMLPMGANFADIDNDGWLDIYLGTGNPEFEMQVPNVMFVNDGGHRFIEATIATQTGHMPKGHGIAFGDIDNDGDLDIFVQAGGFVPGDQQPDAFFLNPGSLGRSVTLELEGRFSNHPAIGARIELVVEDGSGTRSIHRTVSSGGSFGANSLRQTIGVGAEESVSVLRVWWPTSDERQVFEDVLTGAAYRIVEGDQTLYELGLPQIDLRVGESRH